MTIKTIGYSRTFNLGNYESVKVDLSADLDGEELAALAAVTDPKVLQEATDAALDELAMQAKHWVEKRFGPRLSGNKQN
jgi:hypothetical protein